MDPPSRLSLLRARLFLDAGGGHLHAASTWLFVGLLILFFSLRAGERLDDIERQQIREALRASRFVSQIVTRTLDEQRRLVSLFARQKAASIELLIQQPENLDAQSRLHDAMRDFFPDAFAVTVADQLGRPIVDDFEGLIGEICQRNIRHFARQGHGQPIYIHPHPEVYHYDIMVPFARHILFISFKPDKLVRALAENAALGQQLLLYQKDRLLLELTAEGTRKTLKRDFHLDTGEAAALLSRLPVAGTAWTLGVLPNHDDIARQRRGAWFTLLFSIVGAVTLALLLQLLIRLEIRHRLMAEAHAREMAHLSLSDPLTGLPNRRALDEALRREWLEIQRGDTPLALMMVDIDHFKLYNDSLGHQAGDQALRQVAEALRGGLNRPRDLVARYGGEEFVVMLPETPRAAATHVAEGLRHRVRELNLAHPASPTASRVTISIGVFCARRGQTEFPLDLLQFADQALYEAKQAGRDQTRVRGD